MNDPRHAPATNRSTFLQYAQHPVQRRSTHQPTTAAIVTSGDPSHAANNNTGIINDNAMVLQRLARPVTHAFLPLNSVTTSTAGACTRAVTVRAAHPTPETALINSRQPQQTSALDISTTNSQESWSTSASRARRGTNVGSFDNATSTCAAMPTPSAHYSPRGRSPEEQSVLRLSLQRVDALTRRFHADRRRVSRAGAYAVAVAFVGANGVLDRASVATFQRAPTHRPFAPFDVTAVQQQQGHCYVLLSDRCGEGGDAFEPHYCIGGYPQRAVRHYRIDFESLLRLLFFNGFRYVMKPIVVDRCVPAHHRALQP